MTSRARRYWLMFAVVFVVSIPVSLTLMARADRMRGENAPPKTERAPRIDRKVEAAVLDLDDDEIREVVRIVQLYTLEKELGLTEEQLTRVLPKWRRLVDMRSEFWKERRPRLEELAQILSRYDEGDEGVDEATLKKGLEEFRDADARFWSRYRQLEDEILAELTIPQQVRYILIDSDQPRRNSRLVRALKRLSQDGSGKAAGANKPKRRTP